MATYSSGYQFKIINTGEDPDTWGVGTNENFERIEVAIGRAVEVDINPPTAPSTYVPGGDLEWVFTWITTDSSLALDSGGEGRCSYVVFTNTNAVTAVTTVKVRGGTDSDLPTRTFIAKNALGNASVISLDLGGGSPYELRNGQTAMVYSKPNSVANAMGVVQAEGIDLRDVTSPKILARDSEGLAISFNDGSTDVLGVDTAESKIVLSGVADNISISTTSAANPARVTTTASHNLATGDSVEVQGTGVTDMDGIYRNIVVVDADEFDLTGWDGADGTTSDGTVHAAYITVEAGGTDKDLSLASSPGNSSIIITPQGTGDCVASELVGTLEGDAIGNTTGNAPRIIVESGEEESSLNIGGTIPASHTTETNSYTGLSGEYGEVINDGTNALPGRYYPGTGNFVPGSSAVSVGLQPDSLMVKSLKGHESSTSPTLRVNDPVLVSPTVAATDWAGADHNHTTASRGGGVLQDLIPVVKTISLDSISYNCVFETAGQVNSARDNGWYGGTLGTRDSDGVDYTHRVAHGVENPKLVTACLKLESFGDGFVGEYDDGTQTGSFAGYDYYGGWSIGDRIPILSSSIIGDDDAGYYHGGDVQITTMPPNEDIDYSNSFQPDNFRSAATPGRDENGVTVYGEQYGRVNSDTASCSWGWNDDDVYVILGSRMYAGLNDVYPYSNMGSGGLSPFTSPDKSPRWFDSVSAGPAYWFNPDFTPIGVTGVSSNDDTGDGTTTFTVSAATNVALTGMIEGAKISISGPMVSTGGTDNGKGTAVNPVHLTSTNLTRRLTNPTGITPYFLAFSGPGANEYTLKEPTAGSAPGTGIDVVTEGSWVSGGNIQFIPRAGTGAGPQQTGGYRVLGKFLSSQYNFEGGDKLGTPGWVIEFTIHR